MLLRRSIRVEGDAPATDVEHLADPLEGSRTAGRKDLVPQTGADWKSRASTSILHRHAIPIPLLSAGVTTVIGPGAGKLQHELIHSRL